MVDVVRGGSQVKNGVGMNQQLIAYLSQFITPARAERIDAVLKNRTNYIVPVLEDLFQPHNINAAIRSTECLGVQEVHIIEQQNRYSVNTGVSKGASNWITVKRYGREGYNNTQECFERLRSRGYRIYVTSPHVESLSLAQVPLDAKSALVFGAEEKGVSLYAQEHADGFIRLPMYGFTESFNVSVCVALCLNELINRLRASTIRWQLPEEDQLEIKLSWLRMLVRGSEGLEREHLAKI